MTFDWFWILFAGLLVGSLAIGVSVIDANAAIGFENL
jgi:hypothetical protein